MWALRTSFNRAFVDEIKFTCKIRRFDPESKCWLVDESELETAKKIVRTHFGEFEFTDKAIEAPAAPGRDSCQTFLELIGLETAYKAYREASKKHHPDLGGSLEKSQELNRAWNDIKQLLK